MPGLRALSFYTIFHCEYPLLSSRRAAAHRPAARVSLHDVCSLSPSFPFSPPILMGILFTRRRVRDEKSKVRTETGRPIGYRRKILRIDATARRPGRFSVTDNRHSRCNSRTRDRVIALSFSSVPFHIVLGIFGLWALTTHSYGTIDVEDSRVNEFRMGGR